LVFKNRKEKLINSNNKYEIIIKELKEIYDLKAKKYFILVLSYKSSIKNYKNFT